MDEQQRLRERLPDFLNGHVEGEDAAHIDALLKQDPAWQAEARVLADVRSLVHAEMAALAPTEGLDELWRRIDADASARAPSASEVPARARWWQWLVGMRFAPVLIPTVVAALSLVCVVQAWLLAQAPRNELAWRDAPLSIAEPAANLEVRFAADATVQQVETLLLQSHARIAAGPQGGGRYLLQADNVDQALMQLKASKMIIEARPIPPARPAR
jgi:hypothetical protein